MPLDTDLQIDDAQAGRSMTAAQSLLGEIARLRRE